jgi:hypothetical protein
MILRAECCFWIASRHQRVKITVHGVINRGLFSSRHGLSMLRWSSFPLSTTSCVTISLSSSKSDLHLLNSSGRGFNRRISSQKIAYDLFEWPALFQVAILQICSTTKLRFETLPPRLELDNSNKPRRKSYVVNSSKMPCLMMAEWFVVFFFFQRWSEFLAKVRESSTRTYSNGKNVAF